VNTCSPTSSASAVPEEIASAASANAAAHASADANLSELYMPSSGCFMLLEGLSYALLVSRTVPFSPAHATDRLPLLDPATYNEDFHACLIFSSLVLPFPIFTASLNSSHRCSAQACVESFAED
jgi:hypothetical protein